MGPLGEQILPLSLKQEDGGMVRIWDYKSKRNLLVVFLDDDSAAAPWPAIEDLLGWLEQIVISCEECGVSHWPSN